MFRRTLFDVPPEEADYQRLPEEQPGGFQWGNQDNQPDNQNNQDPNEARNQQW